MAVFQCQADGRTLERGWDGRDLLGALRANGRPPSKTVKNREVGQRSSRNEHQASATLVRDQDK